MAEKGSFRPYCHKYGIIPDYCFENEPSPLPLYNVFAEGNGHAASVIASFDNEAEANAYVRESIEVSNSPRGKDWPKVYWVRPNPKYLEAETMQTPDETIAKLRAKLGREPRADEIKAAYDDAMRKWYASMALTAATVPDRE